MNRKRQNNKKTVSGDRLPDNRHEAQCWREFEKKGWTVTKRGWPDLICYRGKELMVVEVKPRGDHPLKRQQGRILKALARNGVQSYRWAPDSGLVPVGTVRDLRKENEELKAELAEYKRAVKLFKAIGRTR